MRDTVVQLNKRIDKENADNLYCLGKIIIKQLMALAFLKPDDTEKEFLYVKASCPETLKDYFKPVFRYYQDFWLGKVKPTGFSIFQKPHNTNNYIEAYHCYLNSIIKKNPSNVDFVSKCES